MSLTIRRATAVDGRLYFNWANDPATRLNSISSEDIEWNDHLRWFQKQLQDADSYMYILLLDGQEVGQVRFNVYDKEALIDYSIDPAHRGKGLGSKILEAACTQLLTDNPQVESLIGKVKVDNVPSARIFEKLGFSLIREEAVGEVAIKVFKKEVA